MNLRYLIVLVTSRCNLKCLYCYNGRPEGRDMPLATLERVMALAARARGPLHIQLTGGEPCLVPELMAQAVRLAQALPQPPRLAVQTNATLLTPQLLSFFKENEIHVGLSLDGPLEINERLRGSSAALSRALALLEAEGVAFNVTTVVTALNVAALDKVPLLLAGYSQARGFGLDLLVNKGRGLAEPAEPQELAAAARRLKLMLAAVNSRRARPLIWREEALCQSDPAEDGSFCHACRAESLAVDPEGRLYPCGQTVGVEALSLGTVEEPGQLRSPLVGLRLTGPHCAGCPLEGRCPGDCPSRLYFNAAQPRLACALYRALAAA